MSSELVTNPGLDPQLKNYIRPSTVDPKSADVNARPLPADIERPITVGPPSPGTGPGVDPQLKNYIRPSS